ncbi:MAG: MFS transporter, partial [Treponema sp.]|nr:MFS transporter [Treponema sp.]
AFGIHASPDSLSALLDIMKAADPPPYLRDTVTLSMSCILDTQNHFYPILVLYLQNPEMLSALAQDEVESALEYFNSNLGKRRRRKNGESADIAAHAKSMEAAVKAYINDMNGQPLSAWIGSLPEEICRENVRTILSGAVLEEELAEHKRLHLLIVHWAAHELRRWTKKAAAESRIKSD